MYNELSEDSKDLLRDMKRSEAWRVYETLQKKNIENLRVLATQRTTPLEDRLWYSAAAQGREDAIIEINETV